MSSFAQPRRDLRAEPGPDAGEPRRGEVPIRGEALELARTITNDAIYRFHEAQHEYRRIEEVCEAKGPEDGALNDWLITAGHLMNLAQESVIYAILAWKSGGGPLGANHLTDPIKVRQANRGYRYGDHLYMVVSNPDLDLEIGQENPSGGHVMRLVIVDMAMVVDAPKGGAR